MFSEYLNEEWKEIELSNYESKKSKFFISNYGRVKNKNSRQQEFKLMDWTVVNGFASCYYPRTDKFF